VGLRYLSRSDSPCGTSGAHRRPDRGWQRGGTLRESSRHSFPTLAVDTPHRSRRPAACTGYSRHREPRSRRCLESRRRQCYLARTARLRRVRSSPESGRRRRPGSGSGARSRPAGRARRCSLWPIERPGTWMRGHPRRGHP
jgi:hypothetical protein